MIKAHDFGKAIETLDRAYEIAPPKSQERSMALWAKGMALYMTAQNMRMDMDYEGAYKKYADAMICFRRVSREENVMDCAYSMAVLNADHFGYKDLAIEQYEYALNIAKELNNAEKQAEIYTDLAAVHKSLHNEREVSLYNARLDSLLSVAPSMSANLFLIKGNNAYQNGDWEVAISWFQRFLVSDPKDDKRFSSLQKLRDSYAKISDDKNVWSIAKNV